MGLIRTKLRLSNPANQTVQPIDVEALVDSGAMHLCVPSHIAIQLKLQEREQREVTLADGKSQLVSYQGPLIVEFAGRSCFSGALVMGDEVLLGAIPMEDMDLVIHPLSRTLSVNPLNPNVPTSVAKGGGPVREQIAHFARHLRARCVVANRLCGEATRRATRLASHPESGGQMHNLFPHGPLPPKRRKQL